MCFDIGSLQARHCDMAVWHEKSARTARTRSPGAHTRTRGDLRFVAPTVGDEVAGVEGLIVLFEARGAPGERRPRERRPPGTGPSVARLGRLTPRGRRVSGFV